MAVASRRNGTASRCDPLSFFDVPHEIGDLFEKRFQFQRDRARNFNLVHRFLHQLQPAISLSDADFEWRVPHSHSRMSALLNVAVRATEAINQKITQTLLGTFPIIVRVHRSDQFIVADAAIKRGDKFRKTRFAELGIDFWFAHRQIRTHPLLAFNSTSTRETLFQMPTETRIVAPGPQDRTVVTADGVTLNVPADWELLPPGDAGMTRRVKSKGPTWTVKQKKGRRTFSLGVWAPEDQIAAVRAELDAERSTEAYAKKRVADLRRREKKQVQYVEDFTGAVLEFLNFDDRHGKLANQMAKAISDHATPVGSGTVARTQRIPLERRAESAVIAWMRHQTTAYDNMKIARVKGKRREVRRMLAAQSKKLLAVYRNGNDIDAATCPLAKVFLENQNR